MTGAIIRHVVEYTRAPVVDGVIKGVKIVGTQSRNGYRYPAAALAAAAKLYEGAPVYMLHGDDREFRRNSRKLDEHFGTLQSIRADSEGLWGDLHVRQSHPMAEFILESDGHKFGLSHNAQLEMNDDETEVTEIVSVNSVDLVDHPATTKHLFEEKKMDLAELVAANKAQAAEIAALKEGQGKILTLLESLKKPEPEKKPDRIKVLEEVTGDADDPTAPAPIGHSHEAFLAKIRGFSTTDTKGAVA